MLACCNAITADAPSQGNVEYVVGPVNICRDNVRLKLRCLPVRADPIRHDLHVKNIAPLLVIDSLKQRHQAQVIDGHRRIMSPVRACCLMRERCKHQTWRQGTLKTSRVLGS